MYLFKIIDPEDGQTVAFQEQGEVCIRGPIIMRGYLERPEATANTLSPDGWLHTGRLTWLLNKQIVYDGGTLFKKIAIYPSGGIRGYMVLQKIAKFYL